MKMKASTGHRRFRWRWKKLASFAILAYLGISFGSSLVHYFYLRQYQAQLARQLHAAKATNAQLATDLHNLKNPTYIKQMLLGKVVTPRPRVSVPVHPVPGTE